MVTEEEKEQHLKDLQETFELDRETAENLVEAHDAFLEQLAHLPDPKVGIILAVTSAVAYASANNVEPHDFMLLVRDVLIQLSEAVPGTTVTEA